MYVYVIPFHQTFRNLSGIFIWQIFFYKVSSRLHVAGEYFKNKIQNKCHPPNIALVLQAPRLLLLDKDTANAAPYCKCRDLRESLQNTNIYTTHQETIHLK